MVVVMVMSVIMVGGTHHELTALCARAQGQGARHFKAFFDPVGAHFF